MSNSAAVIGTPTVSSVTEDTNPQTLVAAGSISISDANAGQAAFKTTVIAASGDLGSLTIAANGAYVYSVADGKVQYLGAGQTKVDTFTVTSLDGTQKQISFTIVGVNDGAVIGTPTVVDVTEDATSPTLKAAGSISISDADQNQAAFKTVGDRGGRRPRHAGPAEQRQLHLLGRRQRRPVPRRRPDQGRHLHGDRARRHPEADFVHHPRHQRRRRDRHADGASTSPKTPPARHLKAAGSISISDADQNQAAFKTSVIAAAGNLGSLVLAANGTYIYSVANGAVQYLGAGDTKVDTFTVTSLDGTQKQVSFTIHGTNDAAVIGTPTVHDVTEDATQPILYAIGTVSITDADQGEAAFQPTLQAGGGNLGALDAGQQGRLHLHRRRQRRAVSSVVGDTKVDTFTLTSLDGTTKQVTFTIHGANDAAVIGTPTVHDVTEDVNVTAGNLTASGTISISDVDQNQSSFQTFGDRGRRALSASLTLAANGAYTYTVANSAVQYPRRQRYSKVDTFTVTSLDGTSKQVTFTIHGANDAAVIGDPTVHDVTEDTHSSTAT